MFAYVTRAGWGARSPSATINRASCSQRKAFITHYSAGPPEQTVRTIQNFHMDTNGWPDIGYNWLVDRNGTIYEGRLYNFDAIGTHAANNNTRAVGCCFIGRDGDVTSAAKAAIRRIYDEACRRCNKQLQMLGHRDVNQTSCPGDNLWTWVHAGMETGMDPNAHDIHPDLPNKQVFRDLWDAMLAADPGYATITRFGFPNPYNKLMSKPALTAADLEAIKQAAKEGAAAGAAGATAEEVETIVINRLERAFTYGASGVAGDGPAPLGDGE